jgi:nucleotide-binding universal stress UspA family protein
MTRTMKKLLIGYDGSTCSSDAINDLRRAGLSSDGIHATVMSIADLLPGVLGADLVKDYPPALKHARFNAEQAMREAREHSERGAEQLRSLFPGWRVSAAAAADSPYWGLVKSAQETQADLIVVGSQGRSALGRLVLGSVSQNAVLYASCSARVGRCRAGRDASSWLIPPRIIVGWDGSADAARAVDAVAARQWPEGTYARLVTALDVRMSTAVPAIVSAELIARGLPPVAQDIDDSLRESARIAAERLRAKGVGVEEPILREGDPKRVLLEEAEAWAADCVFVGAKGLTRIERVLLGSVSAAVAARAECSVEVVR